jgi:hypothetical protein
VDDLTVEVDMVPREIAQFARAQAERDREHEQRFQPFTDGRVMVKPKLTAARSWRATGAQAGPAADRQARRRSGR